MKLHCVRIGAEVHSLQRQANPPTPKDGGAWTHCGAWAERELHSIESREPDCGKCRRLLGITTKNRNPKKVNA